MEPAGWVSRLPAGVFDVLERRLVSDPDATAIVARGGTVTYRELDQLASAAAGALSTLGVRAGDRVAASLPNDLEILAAFHGCMRLGSLWVGINKALALPEKEFLLRDSGAKIVLADDPAVSGGDARLVLDDEWRESLDSADPSFRTTPPDPGVPAAIAYTSGTTGFPKGAVHCQAALLLPGAATVARRGWGPTLRKGDSLPLTILNMMTLTTLLTAQAGGTAVIIDKGDTGSIVEWIRRERVTIWNGPPAQLHTMVRDESITRSDLQSLEEVWVGGGDCPDGLRRDFQERFGVRVSRTYGLTEAPALVSIDDLASIDDPVSIENTGAADASGRPLDHIDVTSPQGELLLGPKSDGPCNGVYRPFLGYWNNPDAAMGVLKHGLLHTGDLGELNDDGHIRVVGRKSQVIIRGGANVYPAEVERVLRDAPGVNACAVVGYPDERLGERVGAVIEPVAGQPSDPDAIKAYCGIHLAAYKVPDRIVFVEQMPRNQMGKVPRAALIDVLAQKADGQYLSRID